MIKGEAKFTTKFSHWAKRNIAPPCVFEIKETKKDYLPFSAVRSHQKSWLLASTRTEGVTWKIPDAGASAKPLDVIMVGNMMSFVVINYPKGFVVINAIHFFREEEESKRKSLTYERAKEISLWKARSLR